MKFKFLLILLALILSPIFLLAQTNPFPVNIPANSNGQHRCYTNQVMHELYESDPVFRANWDNAQNINLQNPANKGAVLPFSDSVIRVPVVFHIIHNNGPENISLSQIESQIRILNEDFRRIPGTNGFGAGVDTKFEFFLAQKDTNDNCTDGIMRYQSSMTNHSSASDAALKNAFPNWEPDKYLNFYVVNSISGGVLGYAYLPPANPVLDGIVLADEFVGDEGTAINGTAYNLGKTASHEIGHWLGLNHTFDGCTNAGNCATAGDFVCDTPPSNSPTFGCPSTPPTKCGNQVQIANYMDYTDDVCMNMFTAGQTTRMLNATLTHRATIADSMNAIDKGFYGCLGIVYCQSEATNTSGTEIRNVSLNTINKNSSNECVGYSDFTTTFTELTQDSSYTLSVTTGHCTNGTLQSHEVKAYIDWDRNGSFTDPGEEYLVKANGTGTSGSVVITVPSNAPLDRTGMRIIATDGGVIGPCNTYAFGETEDYAIQTVAPPPTITAFNPTSGAIGSQVLITGDNFSSVNTVTFNTQNTLFFTILNDDSINVFVPTGATTGPIKVTSPQGFDISAGNYTVTTPLPAITNFTPSSGQVGQSVSIFGNNLGTVSQVFFNGISTTAFTQVGSTLIQTAVPAGASTGKISIQNGVGNAISANDFTVIVPAPTASISGSASTCQGTSAPITFNLTGTPPYNVVYTDGTNNFTLNGITSPHTEQVTPAVGTSIYTIVSVTDQNFVINAPDPSLTGTAIIIVHPRPSSAQLTTNATPICGGEPASITLEVNGGNSPYTINVNNGVGSLSGVINNSTFTVNPNSTTTYSLTSLSDANGCNTNNFIASATVNVNQSPNADFNRSINKSTVTFTDQSSNDAISWNWNFGDSTSSTQQNPVHTYSFTGIKQVRLNVSNALGCVDEYVENILIMVLTGIEGLEFGETINLFPNPTQDQLSIEIKLKTSESVNIEILSTDGKVLKNESSLSKSTDHQIEMNVKDLPSGMYILKFSLSDGRHFNSKVYKN